MITEKNWHVIHVRERQEKKVIKYLAHKKIEFYYPLYSLSSDVLNKLSPIEKKPLFPATIFVRIPEWQFLETGRIKYVTGFLYRLNKPAVIDDADILAISKFLRLYDTISLEQSELGFTGKEKPQDNYMDHCNHDVRLSLPTIGYTLVASSVIKQQPVSPLEKENFMLSEFKFD